MLSTTLVDAGAVNSSYPIVRARTWRRSSDTHGGGSYGVQVQARKQLIQNNGIVIDVAGIDSLRRVAGITACGARTGTRIRQRLE